MLLEWRRVVRPRVAHMANALEKLNAQA